MTTKFFIKSLFLLLLLSTVVSSTNQQQPSYDLNTEFYLLYWVMKFNVSNGHLLNVTLHQVSNFTINDIRENLHKIALNESNLKLKNDSKEWTRIAVMAWTKNAYPTVLYQTFRIDQLIKIEARGCKKGHCKTVTKTAGSADNVFVIWSCKEYNFAKFQGKADLRNCRIANVLHYVPFIYGKGRAEKKNIKNKIFLERDFGDINKYFNTSAANLYALIDAIIKVQQNDPALKKKYNAWTYYNILTNFSLEKRGLSQDQLKNLDGITVHIKGDFLDLSLGDFLLATGLGSLAGFAASFFLGTLASIGVGLVVGIVVLALEGCGEGGSADANFVKITNYFDYVVKNCGSFCERETYIKLEGQERVIKEGDGFITAPVGVYTFPTKKYNSILNTKVRILVELNKTIIKKLKRDPYYLDIIRKYNVENITRDLINIYSNRELITMGEAWALFMAYFDYLGAIGLYNPIFKEPYIYEVIVEKTYYTDCGDWVEDTCDSYSKKETHYMFELGDFCSNNNCMSIKTLSFYDYWVNVVLKEVNRETVDYGGTVARANILDGPYTSFAMTADVFNVRIKELLIDPNTYLGVVKDKAGELPYFSDSEGNKHYLIQAWEVENKTYYLPAIMLIEEPVVSKSIS